METLNIVLLIVGSLVVALGLGSQLLQRIGAPAPLLALATGVLLGPRVLDVVDPAEWGVPTSLLVEEVARVTLGVSLVGVALRLPRGSVRRMGRSLGLSLGGGMVAMWAASSLMAWGCLRLPVWQAALIGAIMTPTDPVVASTIVTGDVAERCLPDRIRELLSAESGANDGLAYPFVLLPLLMLSHDSDVWSHWLLHVLLRGIVGAALIGAAVGWVAGALFRFSERQETIDRPLFGAYTTALALVVLSAVRLLGSDGVLAVFVAGVVLGSTVSPHHRTLTRRAVEGYDRFFTLSSFALLGAVLPWGAWSEMGWPELWLVLLFFTVRRLPFFLAMKRTMPVLQSQKDALFVGWFGPAGVAPLFYAGLAAHRSGLQVTWTVPALLVTASLVGHGLTATPLTRLYRRASGGERTD